MDNQNKINVENVDYKNIQNVVDGEESSNLLDQIRSVVVKAFNNAEDKFDISTTTDEIIDISMRFCQDMRRKFNKLSLTIENLVRKIGFNFRINITFLYDLFYGLYRLVKSDSKFDLFMVLLNFARTLLGDDVEKYMECVNCYLQSFVDDLKSFGKLKSEAVDLSRSNIKRNINVLLSSNLIISVRTLVLNLVSLKFFSKDIAYAFIKTLGKPEPTPLIDCLSNTIDTIDNLITFAYNISSGNSLIQSLIDSDPIAAFLENTYMLTLEAKNVYVGDSLNFPNAAQDGRISAKDFLMKLRPEIQKGDELAHTKSSKINNAFKARLYILKELYNEIYMKIRSQDRRAPFGVVITGLPSIGKSSLLVHIYKLFCEYKGLVYSHDLVYDRSPHSDYWTNHDPLTQPIIHYPELGSVHINIAKNQGDKTIEEMLKVADTQPYSAEMADVESKGKCMVMPDLLVIDCNDPEMNARVLVNNPAAIRRRFLYIKAEVKSKYQVSDTCASLDKDKIMPGDDTMDLWTFQVYRQDPVTCVESVPIYYRNKNNGLNFDIFELSDLFLDLLKKHDKQQDKFGVAVSADIKNYVGKTLKSEAEYTSFLNFSFLIFILPALFNITLTVFCILVLSLFSLYNEFRSQSMCLIDYLKVKVLFYFSYYFVKYRVNSYIADYKHTCLLYIKFIHSLGKKIILGDDVDYNICKMRLQATPLLMKFSFPLTIFVLVLAFTKVVLAIYSCFEDLLVSEGDVIESNNLVTKESVDEKFTSLEKLVGVDFPKAKKKSSTDKDYDNIITLFPKLVGVSDSSLNNKDEINNRIMRNVRYIKSVNNEAGKSIDTIALGLCKDLIIVNSHTVKAGWEVTISATKEFGTAIVRSLIQDDNLSVFGDDLVIVRVPGLLFKDITEYVVDYPLINISVPARIDNLNTYAKQRDGSVIIKNKTHGAYTVRNPLEYNYRKHDNGSCGLPLIITLENRTFVAGIHTGGSLVIGDPHSVATPLYKKDLDAAMRKFTLSKILEICSEGELRLKKGSDKVNITSKCPLLYENCPSLQVIGAISDYTMITPKSTLELSSIAEDVELLTGVSPRGDNGKLKYLPPLMRSKVVNGKYIAPYNNWVKNVGVIKNDLNLSIMNSVVVSLSTYLLNKLREQGVNKLTPFSLAIAQNGYPENFYLRAMKNSTSGGFLLSGNKSKYSEKASFDFKKDAVMPNFDVKEQVYEIINACLNDKMPHSIVGAQLKDEPRAFEKVEAGKTRVFAMSSYDMTLVNRMFLMPYYSLMCEYRDIFCTKVGINMHSDEAQSLYLNLSNFSSNIMEGDYGGYDTSMPVHVGLMANSVVYTMLEQLGYNENALKIVKGILSDNLYPTIAMEGNLFITPGFQPSGKYATAEDNSLRGLILMYYAYAVMCTEIGVGNKFNLTNKFNINDFFKYLLPVTYGDDMLCSVKDEIAVYFNNITYGKFVTEVYGMQFTNADKKMHTSKFTDISAISFLKRSFKFSKLLNRYVAILDVESIVKSLLYVLPSKEVSKDTQIIETMASALREMFFDCDSVEEYNAKRKVFLDVAAKNTRYKDVDIDKIFPYGESLLEQYL